MYPAHQDQDDASPPRPRRASGLRLKFVLLFSLILIVTCSTLSWYFLETRHEAMTANLEEMGIILLTNTVRNDHFRVAGIVLEDRTTLDQFLQSLMSIDHVVYVIITGSDGRLLSRQSKRMQDIGRTPSLTPPSPIYPDDQLSDSLTHIPLTTPLITRLVWSSDHTLIPQQTASDWLVPFLIRKETLYDFAMPILRDTTPLSSPSIELEDNRKVPSPSTQSQVVGIVRIGITDAQAKAALSLIVRNVLILTAFIIATGILIIYLLTSRITTPLRSLAAATRKLAEGEDTTGLPVSSQNDEVGQLTHAFNVMTQSLRDRNQAIGKNLDTIHQQIRQLTTIHQASTTIANTTLFDRNQLLDTVLHLIVDNLGFTRMMVVLQTQEQTHACIARIVGVSPEIVEGVRRLHVPISDNGGITAELLLHGKAVLVHDVETATHRFYPPILELVRRSGIQSFVGAPLQSHGKILGYLAGDRGTHRCTDEDLHTLVTIAGHVAAAIDNATAYADLAELTQHLEERIEQRTEELSQANAQLQEHDRRRSKFLSVVSHELRTPMTAIRSFAENMLDGVTGPLTDLQHTYLTRVQHNVARLSRIIAQLLDWSRLDTKRVDLRLEPVCLHQIATIAVDSLQTVASENQVSLVVVPSESLPLVLGDRDKLEQIFVNLIGNAIKFTQPGGQVWVESCVSSPDVVRMCVADTGCGIDETHLANIFEEFSKVPSAMPSSQGAQLGLWITKTYVTMHHGRIWVESQPGAGSHFYFALPTRESLDQPQPNPNEPVSADGTQHWHMSF
ncbi:MAG: HAMP domain-containing protein [Nitrospira sp.]|nr:HAMP domain-containing protein [Nitrospira sp.]